MRYGKTGTPQTANFIIDVSEAEDLDRHTVSGAIGDAGLDEGGTTWTCSPGSGAIDSGEFSTIFTPSNVVQSDGTFDYGMWSYGILPWGSAGTVATVFAAAYTPYAAAGVAVLTWLMGSKPHTNYAIVGESIIENGSGSPQKINASEVL